MSTIALRVPTVLPGQEPLAGGHCYILFPGGPISVRELIAEKVRAELRKARAGGATASSVHLLLPQDAVIGFRPLDEQLLIAQAWSAFVDGMFLLLCDGRPLVDLDEPIDLKRGTALLFVHVPSPVVAEEPGAYRDAA